LAGLLGELIFKFVIAAGTGADGPGCFAAVSTFPGWRVLLDSERGEFVAEALEVSAGIGATATAGCAGSAETGRT
jgi:hypothetical protein